MVKLKDIYFHITGIDDSGKQDVVVKLCYTSSPAHAIKQYVQQGWNIDNLKVRAIIKGQ